MRLSIPASAAVALVGLALAAAALSGCATMIDDAVTGAISAPASEVQARHGAGPMPGDPQTLMTRKRRPNRADRVRAERLAAEIRRGIARFRDVEAATEAGYRPFPPEPPPEMQVIHYVHPEHSRREGDEGFDPERPGSLLYERDGTGGLRLVGAMITAPVHAELEDLDAAVPLSVTRWHLHQNVCVPRPLWDEEAWGRTAADGRPLFGPGSPTVTEAACDRLGGRFLPTVFGWMAHAYVYAEDPADTWNAMYGHGGGHDEGHGHGGH